MYDEKRARSPSLRTQRFPVQQSPGEEARKVSPEGDWCLAHQETLWALG